LPRPLCPAVKRFNGVTFETVGKAGFTEGEANWLTFALDRTTNPGRPYVAFQDGGAGGFGGRASVMTYDGSSWVYVGRCGGSRLGSRGRWSAAEHAGGLPSNDFHGRIAPSNLFASAPCTHPGASCAPPCRPGISEPAGTTCTVSDCLIEAPSLRLASNGLPVLSYRDAGAVCQQAAGGPRLSTLQYDGVNWNYAGARCVGDSPFALQLSLDSSNIPAVFVTDSSTRDGTVWRYAS